eukprot:gene11843-5173_t
MKYEVANPKITNVLDMVISTTEEVIKESKHVSINEEALKKFVKHLDFEKIQNSSGTNVPIKFETIEEEINFHCIKAVLSFGSGYRNLLHKHLGRGANETITYGLLGMILSDKRLDAYDISQITSMDIEKDFSISHQVEGNHPNNQFIKIQKDSELKGFSDKIKFVLNDCGRVLRSLDCKNFGDFVLKTLKKNDTAEYLIEELIKNFVAFNDVSKWKNGKEIFFLKKAQLVIGELYYNLKDKNKLFQFPDIDKLTLFADNVIPCVLIKEGILQISETLKSKIENKKEIFEEDIDLRSGSIIAGQKIIKLSNKKINSVELDFYLWGILGKEKEFKKLERHITCETIFY